VALGERHMQIGEVAERTGLSLRTIRYYGEVGLAAPSARSPGGFRLYAEADVRRLLLIKQMKPLGFSLEEMAGLLGLLDRLTAAHGGERTGLRDRLAMYEQAVQARCAALRDELHTAEEFAAHLRAAGVRETNRK
jgi:DNA-binding transcriptional MerR regulator